ncbi:heme oxygenase [Denticeps clupeoides]|uniref:heme oxygenase (biliverdin-producing) n=1 Tax=Denticeps clupeoides TaxID=299321 RepID=A0AAY4A0P6_9TELE|nr:heme oxygenase-like [Denticeps clupeoides]
MTSEGQQRPITDTQVTDSDLSEQIKAVTKDSHVRAENTELMRSYVKGQVTLSQYKMLLCSLYEIYKALEEEMDHNASHPAVAPVYFPVELARLECLEKDLEHFYGPDWRNKIVVPAATLNYTQRLREIGEKHPEYLVAHAYTRYLGDLSGGQVLGRITQKSLGLKSNDGLSFFYFPGVSSPNRFKQLYRGRMNSIELSSEERAGLLQEAVRAFQLNIQVFDDIQKTLSIVELGAESSWTHEKPIQQQQQHLVHGEKPVQISSSFLSASPLLRMMLGVCVALAVGMGMYAI